MILNVIYKGTTPFCIINFRAKRFFDGTQYICRGNVYSFEDAHISISVNRGEIRVFISEDKEDSIELLKKFINFVLKDTKVSIYSDDLVANNSKYHFRRKDECKI